MTTALRQTGYPSAALLLLAALAATWLCLAPSRKVNAHVPAADRLVQSGPAQLADGSRQLSLLGCISCHGAGLRGKLVADDDFVRLYAPNVTLVAATASDEQLAQAIRQGIGRDGHPLFGMPCAQFMHLDDVEVAALIAAIRALPRGGSQTSPMKLRPNGRIAFAKGQFLTQPEAIKRYRANLPIDLGPRYAFGRHLAMTNCIECHGASLSGNDSEGSMTIPNLSLAGTYDLPAFTKMLRTGVSANNKKLKLMDEASPQQFSHFTDNEIAALHAYLVERAKRGA